jgi:hypothetical protein
MAEFNTVDTPSLSLSNGMLEVEVTGFRYPADPSRAFVSIHVRVPQAVMDFGFHLTPSECGALAERLLQVKAGIEDATGEAG